MNEQENIQLPRCAVVVATRDNARWIMGAIESIVYQDYPEKIIYIIDDCSTDNTLEVIENNQNILTKLPASHSDDIIEKTRLFNFNNVSIHYFRLKENHGPSFARNIAIDHAINYNNCHAIAILDSDDQFLQGKLSKCIQMIIQDPQAIAGCYCDYCHLNVENGSISYFPAWSYDIMRLRQESIVHSGAVYNVLALKWMKENFGYYYNEQLLTVEDWCLNKMLAQRWLFIHIPEPLTLVRVHNNSSINYRSKEEWEKNWRYVASIPL